MFSFDKGRHTDNMSNGGLPLNYMGYLVNGTAKLVSKDTTVTLKEGEFFYIPKGCPYRSYWYTDRDSKLLWYSIGFDCIPLAEGGNFLLQKFEADPFSKDIYNDITKDLKSSIKNVGLFYLFLSEVADKLKRDSKAYEASLEKALNYMKNNTDARMKEVANYCNISEATLYTLFKKRFNKTPNEVRQKILCEKAEELLITTSLSVEEISDKLGFSSSSYFRKIIKKHLNTTPTSIRKRSV